MPLLLAVSSPPRLTVLLNPNTITALSAMVDLYLAVYPAVILFKLQMNLRKKLALSIALGLGSIATAVAIYKSTRLTALASPDFSCEWKSVHH
jgi:hypothetical protein